MKISRKQNESILKYANRRFMILLALILVCAGVFMSSFAIYATERVNLKEQTTSGTMLVPEDNPYQDYVSILYNSENGMPTSEANDVIQTSDGFIWIASYSGLIRYDGSAFTRITDADGVASANTLFIDSDDQLWIGTNDDGLMRYDQGMYKKYSVSDGLPSDSVKAIVQDSKGNYYIGTTDGIGRIDHESGAVTEITSLQMKDSYIASMVVLADDTVICVTNSGMMYAIQNTRVNVLNLPDSVEKKPVVSVHVSSDKREWYFGTEEDKIYLCSGNVEDFQVKELSCGSLKRINEIQYISDGTLWICGDNGVGYFDNDEQLHILDNFELNNSVDHMIQDYEGNLWFASSRQGIFKCTKNYFVDVNKKAGLSGNVVNSVTKYEGLLYVATDTGLLAINESNNAISNTLTRYIGTARIRCLLTDEAGDLWICTYGNLGLVRVHGDSITSINSEDGLNTNKVRSVIEGSNHQIYVATADGIYEIFEGKVIAHIGTEEGLTNQEVLSLCQLEDGTLYAGTDGGGLCVIENRKVTEVIDSTTGLRSSIIMRIRYDEELKGLWLITSNSIAFYSKENGASNINKFPYSNNYDLYFGENDSLWILSSDGLYVTQRESMMSDHDLIYTFYDYNSGMPSTPTANSFSYIDESKEIMYICGSSGVYSIQMNLDDGNNDTTKLAIPDIVCDGEAKWTTDNQVTVASDVKRIRINAYALSYGLQNPLIEYYLEGFDAERVTVRKSEFSNVVYTNLSGGDYTFHFSIIDPSTGEQIVTRTLQIHKEYKLVEYVWFWLCIILAISGTIVGVVFFAFKFRMKSVILHQEEQQKIALADALEMAENASQAKTDFLSRMSHDIRTPMNAVIGISELGMDECKNEVALDYFRKINSSGTYLLGLINDVLDMSRIEQGKVELSEDVIDSMAFFNNIITMLKPILEKRSIELKCDFSQLHVRYAYGDKIRMEQVYMNLLSNAIKYSEPGSVVEWTATEIQQKDGNVYYKVIVRDHGCGMSEDFLKRIFEPFAQEKNIYSGETASTGLGLAICKNLIDQMDGTIKVESELGNGSTFTLFMTSRIAKAPSVGQLDALHDEDVLAGKHVLLVEDHPLNMEIATKILEKKGIVVTVAHDGLEAVDAFEKSDLNEFDAILMDIRMPNMNGLEASEAIRKENRRDAKTIPIIAMTANAYQEDKDACKAAGMSDHLAKPINTSELYGLLSAMFRAK